MQLQLRDRKITAFVLILLISALPILLFLDYSHILSSAISRVYEIPAQQGGVELCRAASCPSKNDATSFLIEEYKVAAQEIRSRLEHEHLLFVLKFALAGGILGVVFRYYGGRIDAHKDKSAEDALPEEAQFVTSRATCLCSWAAVFILSIIDVRLQFNTRVISDIGSWIKNCLEPCLPSSLVGWEKYFSLTGVQEHSALASFLNGDRVLLTGLLYLSTVYLFIYIPKFLPGFDPRLSKDLLTIAKRTLPVCVILFGWSRWPHYFDKNVVNIAYVIVVISVLVLVQVSMHFLMKLDLSKTAR